MLWGKISFLEKNCSIFQKIWERRHISKMWGDAIMLEKWGKIPPNVGNLEGLIFEKLCFDMYCLCDKACQFPVIGKLLELFFHNCYLTDYNTVTVQTLGHSWRDSLTKPKCFLQFWPEDHWEPHNEVGPLSPAEHLVGFEPGTFQF